MDMSTSVLISNKAKRKILFAAKKKCIPVRYSLRSPHDNIWPIIDESNGILLKEFLIRLLMPASKVIHTSKEMRAHLILGVNMLTRSLEKGEVCCALLDSTFNPKIGISHIVSMCPLKEVPLLVVPNLRQIVCKALGFSCVALGFKKYVADSKDNHFHPIYDMVIQMVPATPSVKPTISELKSSDIKFPLQEDDSSSDCDAFAIFSIPTVEHDTKQSPETNIAPYLYRTSKKERAFTCDQPNIPGPLSTSSQFISLNMDDAMSYPCNKEPKSLSTSTEFMSLNLEDDVMPSPMSYVSRNKKQKLRGKKDKSTFSLPPRTKNPNSPLKHAQNVVEPHVLQPGQGTYLPARVERILPNSKKVRKAKRKLPKQN